MRFSLNFVYLKCLARSQNAWHASSCVNENVYVCVIPTMHEAQSEFFDFFVHDVQFWRGCCWGIIYIHIYDVTFRSIYLNTFYPKLILFAVGHSWSKWSKLHIFQLISMGHSISCKAITYFSTSELNQSTKTYVPYTDKCALWLGFYVQQ